MEDDKSAGKTLRVAQVLQNDWPMLVANLPGSNMFGNGDLPGVVGLAVGDKVKTTAGVSRWIIDLQVVDGIAVAYKRTSVSSAKVAEAAAAGQPELFSAQLDPGHHRWHAVNSIIVVMQMGADLRYPISAPQAAPDAGTL